MISKYRNRAIAKISTAIVMGIVAGFIVKVSHWSKNDGVAAVWILLTVATVALYAWGSADLAKAKGYSEGIVPVVMLVGFFCFPVVIPAIPLIILFALKDKTTSRSKWDYRRS